MALGGGSPPATPAAQPITPVPQEDDPKGIEEQRRAAAAAKDREGYSAHLLSGKGSDSAAGVDPISGGAKKPATASMME